MDGEALRGMGQALDEVVAEMGPVRRRGRGRGRRGGGFGFRRGGGGRGAMRRAAEGRGGRGDEMDTDKDRPIRGRGDVVPKPVFSTSGAAGMYMIRVSNLGDKVQASDLEDFFTQLVGENRVKHANVFFDANGNPTGVGEVAFHKRSNMFMARRVANGMMIDGRRVSVTCVDDDDVDPDSRETRRVAREVRGRIGGRGFDRRRGGFPERPGEGPRRGDRGDRGDRGGRGRRRDRRGGAEGSEEIARRMDEEL